MAGTTLGVSAPDAPAVIRNEPVQVRSTKRLATLLDSAAAAIDELGYERLTTAMIAERAGASIGTVYRYFPDRIAVLQALAVRNYERVYTRVIDAISDSKNSNGLDAMSAAFEIFVDAFRTEPGFHSLRIGDVIDLRPTASGPTNNDRLAKAMFDVIVNRFGVTDDQQSRLTFAAAIETTDALVARAFARDNSGDPAWLEQGRQFVRLALEKHFA